MPSLSMPLFVDPADVILRMQLGAELEGVTEVVSNGIIGAQQHVQRIMGGKIARTSWDKKYFLDADAFSGIRSGGVYRLEIPSPFVRQDVDVVVTYLQPDTTTGKLSPFGEYTETDSSLYEIDYNRGYLLMDGDTYNDCFVRVQCDTGFNDGSDPSVPMEQIPVELYEAIMTLVPVVFDISRITSSDKNPMEKYKAALDHATFLLQGFVRVQGFTIRAI